MESFSSAISSMLFGCTCLLWGFPRFCGFVFCCGSFSTLIFCPLRLNGGLEPPVQIAITSSDPISTTTPAVHIANAEASRSIAKLAQPTKRDGAEMSGAGIVPGSPTKSESAANAMSLDNDLDLDETLTNNEPAGQKWKEDEVSHEMIVCAAKVAEDDLMKRIETPSARAWWKN